MKVALCLSGQPRCLDECFDSLNEYIIKPLNCDVFLHFWNSSFLPFDDRTAKILYGTDFVPQWKRFDDEYALKYLAALKPKRFIVEHQRMMDIDEFMRSCNPANSRMQAKSFTNVLSMFHSIYMSNMCRVEWQQMHGFKYDAVIRCRADLKFFKTPELLSLDKVSLLNEDGYGGLNDQFAFSDDGNMNTYSICVDNIPRLFREGTNFHPETILRDHLKLYNTGINFIDRCYYIVR